MFLKSSLNDLNNLANLRTLLLVSKQTSWQILGKAVTSLMGVVFLSAVSRSYGAAGVGIYTLSLTYLSFFYLGTDLGINAHALKSLSAQDVLGTKWQKLFGARLFLAVSLLCISLVLAFVIPGLTFSFRIAVVFGAFAILGYATYISSAALFQLKHKYQYAAVSTAVGLIPNLALLFFALKYSLGVPILLLGHTLGWSFIGVTSLFLIKKLSNISPVISLSYLKQTIVQVWPLSATLLLNIVYFRADAFILSYFRGLLETGVYNLSFQIFQTILVLPTFIVNALYPLLLKSYSVGSTEFKNRVYRWFLLMILISFIVGIFTYFLSPLMVRLIAGEDGFAGSIVSLKMLSFGFPAFFASALAIWILVLLKKYKQILLIYFIGLIINIILNVYFIPQYSYYASSLTTVFCEYLILILQLIILKLYFSR